MDLNPRLDDWTRSDGPYEIASHCLSNKANVLILLNAWLDSEKDRDEAYDWSTLGYWADRLQPLWADNVKNGDNDTESDGPSSSPIRADRDNGRETIVVVCNRCGEENGKSSIFFSESVS
jgi:hypothetical protein